MNPVILISSCKRDVDQRLNQTIRETWGKDSKIPYFFLLGDGNAPTQPDEIVLAGVKDDYYSLPHKTQQGHAWAKAQGFDWTFQAFTDTYIDTERLLASGFAEKGDYIGNKGAWAKNSKERAGLEFCHGGTGYWLSPRATDLIIAADIGNENLEDQFVATVMKANGIRITDDKRYSMGTTYNFREPKVLATNSVITNHLSDSAHKCTPAIIQTSFRERFK